MIGEGGFGCVYKGVIKSAEDPSTKIEVAVKQLGKRGMQVRLIPHDFILEISFNPIISRSIIVKTSVVCFLVLNIS